MRPGRLFPSALGLAAAILAVSPACAAPVLSLSADDREAIARVAVAEAGNQGESGLAAVVQTVLNRLASGGWGTSAQQVIDAPHQFEPVARVGGDWRRLPAPSATQRAEVDTILALIADGRLPDFIGGALYFQNPRIVAGRIATGTTAPRLLNFGGRTPVAVIRDHAFYAGPVPQRHTESASAVDEIFIENPAAAPKPSALPADPVPSSDSAKVEPGRGIFILSDGRLAEDSPPSGPGR